MYFVIEAGGSQYKVQAGNKIWLNYVAGEEGSSQYFKVLACLDNGTMSLGTCSSLEGKVVLGKVQKVCKGPKVISFYLRRRKNSRRKKGHRQPVSQVRIVGLTPASC